MFQMQEQNRDDCVFNPFTQFLNSLKFRVFLVHLLAKGNVISEPTSLDYLQWPTPMISLLNSSLPIL